MAPTADKTVGLQDSCLCSVTSCFDPNLVIRNCVQRGKNPKRYNQEAVEVRWCFSAIQGAAEAQTPVKRFPWEAGRCESTKHL